MIHPFSQPLIHPVESGGVFMGGWGAGANPSCHRGEAGYTLDHSSNTENRQPFTLTFPTVSGLWENARVLWRNPRRHGENTQAPHRKLVCVLSLNFEIFQLLSRANQTLSHVNEFSCAKNTFRASGVTFVIVVCKWAVSCKSVTVSRKWVNNMNKVNDLLWYNNWFAWSFLVKELLSCIDNGVFATLATIYNSFTWT